MLSSYILKAWAGGRAAASKGASGSIASARMLQSVVEPRPSAAATHPAHQPPSLSRVFRKNEGGRGGWRATRTSSCPVWSPSATLPQHRASSTGPEGSSRSGTMPEAENSSSGSSSSKFRFAQRNSFAGLDGFSLQGGRVRFDDDDDGSSSSSSNAYGHDLDGIDTAMQSTGTATGKKKKSVHLNRGKFIDKKRILARGGRGGTWRTATLPCTTLH